jgi:DNA-binding beta-propeller fold protein YncE
LSPEASIDSPYYALHVARTRRLIGLLCLLALVVIGIDVSGFEIRLPRVGGGSSASTQASLPGVRAVGSTPLLRVGNGAPAGGDLAFLATEPNGNLVVSDRARKSILRFDAAGHLLSEWGPRLGETQLSEPAGVAVQGGAYYVVDRGTPRVFRLDGSGRVLNTFSLEAQGVYGLNGLAIDSSDNLYVADTGRNRILMLAPTGAVVKQFGKGGSGLGDFTQPMMLAFLPDGSSVVADWENSRLEHWDTTFNALDAWSVGFHPFGVAVDPYGRIYLPDSEKRRIVAYTQRGDVLGEMGGPDGQTIDVSPRQIAVGPGLPVALYALGSDGIVRLDLENTTPPPQGSSDIDLVSPILFLLLLAVPVVALVMRRGRHRSLRSASHGPIGLDAENRAQREDQQASADQPLLVPDQPKRK